MKRWLHDLCRVRRVFRGVRADVTIVQTTTVEGGMAAMAPAGANIVAEDDDPDQGHEVAHRHGDAGDHVDVDDRRSRRRSR